VRVSGSLEGAFNEADFYFGSLLVDDVLTCGSVGHGLPVPLRKVPIFQSWAHSISFVMFSWRASFHRAWLASLEIKALAL
jgi:hypothetical protein